MKEKISSIYFDGIKGFNKFNCTSNQGKNIFKYKYM